jgi:integrase
MIPSTDDLINDAYAAGEQARDDGGDDAQETSGVPTGALPHFDDADADASPSSDPPSIDAWIDATRAAYHERDVSPRSALRGLFWTEYYLRFYGLDHVRDLRLKHLRAFVALIGMTGDLPKKVRRNVAKALALFHADLLGQTISRADWQACERAAEAPLRRLFPEQKRAVLRELRGQTRVLAQLVLGADLTIPEALRLRVRDLDLDAGTVTVHASDGRDAPARTERLPARVRRALESHLAGVQALHEEDRAMGHGGVYLASEQVEAGADPEAWTWQYVFPHAKLSRDMFSGERRRTPMEPDPVRQAVGSVLTKTLGSAQSALDQAASAPTGRWVRAGADDDTLVPPTLAGLVQPSGADDARPSAAMG